MPDSVTQWARLTLLVGVMVEPLSRLNVLTSPAERAVERMFSQQAVSFEGTVLFERAGNRQFMAVSCRTPRGRRDAAHERHGQSAYRAVVSPVRSPERI